LPQINVDVHLQAFELQVFEKLQLLYAFKDTSQQCPEVTQKIITLTEGFSNEIQVLLRPHCGVYTILHLLKGHEFVFIERGISVLHFIRVQILQSLIILQCLAKQFNEMNVNITKSRGLKNVDQDIFESDSNHEDSHDNTGTAFYILYKYRLFLSYCLLFYYLYNIQPSFFFCILILALLILLHHIEWAMGFQITRLRVTVPCTNIKLEDKES
jgi:hypothetical protein